MRDETPSQFTTVTVSLERHACRRLRCRGQLLAGLLVQLACWGRLLAGSAVVEVKADLETNYIQNGTEIYVVHGPPITSATLGVIAGRVPEFRISVSRLVFADSPLSERFEFGEVAEPEDFLALGNSERLRALTGRTPEAAISTQFAFSYSLKRLEQGFQLTFRSGMDEITVVAPMETGDATVRINGVLLPLDTVRSVPESTIELTQDFAVDRPPVELAFADASAAVNRLSAFGEIVAPFDAVPASAFNDCGDECMSCVLDGVAYGASFLAFGLCGPTGGIGCAVGAALGHFVAAGLAVKDCGRCMVCIDHSGGTAAQIPDVPNCPTGYMPCGGGTCCADPTACPPGYHDCGYNTCCSDGCSQCYPCAPVCACGCE